ncbi:MAG TPA: hypothetical protein VEA99_18260 [Gemmatimonadaceae bacterium]|nr:hypothetical protein [Gemmatimonadaceae bacterium]
MSNDAQIAGSSPAAEQSTAPAPRTLDSLSDSELASWRLSGELPSASQESSPTAESTPAEPAEQAASTDATPPPASEPGKPAKKANADTRVQELLRERAELRQRLEALERGERPAPPSVPDASPAESSPAAAVGETFPDFDTWIQQPGHDAKTYEEYIDARTEWRWEQRQHAEQAAAVTRQRVRAFTERYTAAQAADPTFVQSLSPAVLALQPIDALPPGAAVSPLNVLAQEIVQSEVAPQLLRHFSAHPQELEALRHAAPAVVVRTVAKLEARLEGAAQAGSVTPQPTVTQAPEPPPTLGSKPAQPVDEAAAAVARGDFRSYAAAENRRELAARR